MKFILSALCLFILVFSLNGQSSRLSVKRSLAKRFAKQVTESVLIVPVGSETDPEEKALMDAIKKYWKVSKFEFVPGNDFESIYKANFQANKTCMYLVRESYDRKKTRKKDWSFTKYYISVNPTFIESWDDPSIQFKLPVKAVNRANPEPVNCSYVYGLMMKHMNREVLCLLDPAKYGRVSRRSLYKATFKGDLKTYADREMLVSKKELDNFMMNLREEDKSKIQEIKFMRYLAKKTKIAPLKIKFVGDDVIKKAVSSEDKRVLIYTGFSIFRAEDAAMLRRIDPHRSHRITSNIVFTFSFICALALALLLISYF